MIYLLMADGATPDFPEAESAGIEDAMLVLRDKNGLPIHTMDAILVTAYGTKEAYFRGVAMPPANHNGHG